MIIHDGDSRGPASVPPLNWTDLLILIVFVASLTGLIIAGIK